jgi:hypothetical protein
LRCGLPLLALLALVACGRRHEPGKLDETAAKDLFEIVELTDAPPGMSDLTVDDKGTVWAIAERQRVVLELANPLVKHPLEGFDKGLDTEAIAWLGGGKLAVGLESTGSPLAAVAWAELQGDRVVMTSKRELTTAELLGVAPTTNHGIEGLCGQRDEVLAATETVGKLRDGTRWSVLARLRGDTLEVAKLRLTTTKGKIAALSCTIAEDGTADVIAIERHYGVSRILHFTAKRGDTEITPELVHDLAPVLHDSLNLEGIARLPDGRLVVINDNQGASIKGPTKLLYFHAAK